MFRSRLLKYYRLAVTFVIFQQTLRYQQALAHQESWTSPPEEALVLQQAERGKSPRTFM